MSYLLDPRWQEARAAWVAENYPSADEALARRAVAIHEMFRIEVEHEAALLRPGDRREVA